MLVYRCSAAYPDDEVAEHVDTVLHNLFPDSCSPRQEALGIYRMDESDAVVRGEADPAIRPLGEGPDMVGLITGLDIVETRRDSLRSQCEAIVAKTKDAIEAADVRRWELVAYRDSVRALASHAVLGGLKNFPQGLLMEKFAECWRASQPLLVRVAHWPGRKVSGVAKWFRQKLKGDDRAAPLSAAEEYRKRFSEDFKDSVSKLLSRLSQPTLNVEVSSVSEETRELRDALRNLVSRNEKDYGISSSGREKAGCSVPRPSLLKSELEKVIQAITSSGRDEWIEAAADKASFNADYSDLLDRVLQRADALVCVFPAQDPKRRDNLVRLAEKVSQYQAEHVFLVLNQCDRITEGELDEIRRDFEQNIRKSWTKTGRVFLVSARASLENPNWTDGERPLHGVNEFAALCSAIRELDGSRFADRRIERARELRRETERYVRDCICECGDWDALCDDLKKFEGELVGRLVEQEADRLVSRTGDFSTLVYRRSAERWHGPIGFYLHAGVFIGSVVSALRYLNPFNWPKRAVAKFQGIFNKGRSDEESLCDESLEFDWDAVKGAVLDGWPGIGPELVGKFKMSPDLIDAEKAVVLDGLERTLMQQWHRSLNESVDKMARAKSRPFWQFTAHLPLVAMLSWSFYELIVDYCRGQYLPPAYFQHLGTIVLLLWLLPSWLVRSMIARSGPKAKEALKKDLVSSKVNASMLPVLQDVETLISLRKQVAG